MSGGGFSRMCFMLTVTITMFLKPKQDACPNIPKVHDVPMPGSYEVSRGFCVAGLVVLSGFWLVACLQKLKEPILNCIQYFCL